jgi:hypothetical protein
MVPVAARSWSSRPVIRKPEITKNTRTPRFAVSIDPDGKDGTDGHPAVPDR